VTRGRVRRGADATPTVRTARSLGGDRAGTEGTMDSGRVTTGRVGRGWEYGRGAAAVLLAAAVLAALVAGGGGPLAAQPKLPVVLLGDDNTSLHHTVFYYMAELCPQKHGFTIQHVQTARYTDRILLLQKGDIQFAAGGYSVLANIIEENIPVVAVSGNINKAYGLLVRKGIDVKSWKDLEGKKVAAASNSIVEHHVIVSAKEHGADVGKINMIKMLPGPAALIALQRGDIDAISSWEPWLAQGVAKDFGYVPLEMADNSIGPINGLTQVNRDWLAKNRELATRFVRCQVEAMEYLTSKPDEFARMAPRWVSVDAQTVQYAMKNFRYDANMYQKNAETYVTLLHQLGLSKTNTADRIGTAFDYSILQEITGKTPEQLGKNGFARK
jgi:ABC-type nitrate/sulfonate/bicarbonate transport system substrate-binding protein